MTTKEEIDLVFKILGKKELHVQEIAQHIKNTIASYSDISIEEIQRRINTHLANDVKKKTEHHYKKSINPKTKKPRKGYYTQYSKKAPSTKIKPDSLQQKLTGICAQDGYDNTIQTAPTLYTGKAGEFAVASELIFRGYNASIMSVDEGIDITASKGDKFYFIQVKTTLFSNNQITISIKSSNFIKRTKEPIHYIIVFRYPRDNAYMNRYIVLKDYDLNRYVNSSLLQKNGDTSSIKIRLQEGHLFIYNGSKQENIDYYLDNFDLIQ